MSLQYFLDLAICGNNPRCSSGEAYARQLRDVVHDCLGGLDAKAQAGFVEFVRKAIEPAPAKERLPHPATEMASSTWWYKGPGDLDSQERAARDRD